MRSMADYVLKTARTGMINNRNWILDGPKAEIVR